MIGIKTYNDIYLAVRKRLRDSGVEGYDLEARLLAAKAAGKSVEDFLRDSKFYVNDDAFENELTSLADRRISGEPIAYITGEWEFYGLPVKVTGDVLIPRIDTEVLVTAAIELLTLREPDRRVLDLCTGSGCVGMALTANVPSCRIVLADNSREALAVCRQNLLNNRLTRRASCVEVDALEAPPMLLGTFDMIVCNPPYIPTSEIIGLDSSVRDYEPLSALDGGADGLDFYRAVASKWKAVLRKDGYILFECGEGQAGDVMDIMESNGFEDIKTYRDTIGVERVVSGRLTQNQEWRSNNG